MLPTLKLIFFVVFSEMEVENSVFASPTPVRQAIKRKAKDVAIDTTRKNLDEFLSDSETQSETESSVKGIRYSYISIEF